MKDVPVGPDRPDNLFESLDDQAATHGRFDQQAKERNPQLLATTHRPLGAGALSGVAAAVVGVARAVR